jgi:hypothetical protein
VVLPFAGIALIHFLKRGDPREKADAGKEMAKGAGDGIIGGILSRLFWPSSTVASSWRLRSWVRWGGHAISRAEPLGRGSGCCSTTATGNARKRPGCSLPGRLLRWFPTGQEGAFAVLVEPVEEGS